MALPQQRADAVKGVSAGRLPAAVTFETNGFGEQHPIAFNAAEAGRRSSRQVEIAFCPVMT